MSEHSHDSVWRQLENYYQTSDPAPLTRALCQLMAEYATEQRIVTIFGIAGLYPQPRPGVLTHGRMNMLSA